MRTPYAFVLGLVGLALVSEARAQRITGGIAGSITDPTGAVLPGVVVTLTGDSIMAERIATSNGEGFYRFGNVPTGVYDLAFVLGGFAPVVHEKVTVYVGRDTTLDLAYPLSIGEDVRVDATARAVHPRNPQLDFILDRDYVENAPLERFSFFDLIHSAPGVHQSTTDGSRSTALGSPADENAYRMDGTDFTAPLTGAAWPHPNPDAIEQVEILVGGAPAEYGNVSGGVFNVVTRQGSNDVHGDVNIFHGSQSLTGRNTTDEQDGGYPYHRELYRDASVQLGGPIVPDRLWLFGSYQYQRDHAAPAGVDPQFFTRTESDRMFLKGNWQITGRQSLQLTYHNDYYFLPSTPAANMAPTNVSVESGDNPSPGVVYTAFVSDDTIIEARYSGFYGDDRFEPITDGQPRDQPWFYDVDSGVLSGGTFLWYEAELWKTAVSAKVTHFADDFLGGSHDFKFGVQFNHGGSETVIGYNDGVYTYSYYGSRYAFGYRHQPYAYGGTATETGIFFDDTFRASSRATLNLGVRFDENRASIPDLLGRDVNGIPTGSVSPAVADLYTWRSVSPRLGVSVALTGDNRTALKAHWGRYYRGIITGEFASRLGASPHATFGGPYDLDTHRFIELSEFSSSERFAIGEGYQQPFTDQVFVSLERELARDVSLALSYTHKRGRRYPAWQDVAGVYRDTVYVDDRGADASGGRIVVQELVSDPAERFFVMTNPPAMRTRVDAVTLEGTKRARGDWQLSTSLTWQKSEGTLPTSGSLFTATAAQNGSLLFNDFGQNPNDFVNADGRLIGDRPWTAKAQLVYHLPANFLVGASYIYTTGRPWGRTIFVPELGIQTEIRAERIDGSRRVSDWNFLDLRVQRDIALGANVRVGIFGDVFNVFNDDAHESVLTQLGTAETFGVPDGFVPPRRLRLGVKLVF